MRLSFLLVLFFITKGCVSQAQINLAPHQWKNRVLLFFVPDEKEAVWQEQQRILNSDSQGIAERHLVIYQPNYSDPLWKKYSAAAEEFTVILIGKDGTEKLRQSQPLHLEKIYMIIDSMPMRRREMREQRKQK